jgi:hypothetical protein
VKDAESATATVIVRFVLSDPEPFVTVRVTVFEPAVVKVWFGFRELAVEPSPKFQAHEVGVPVEVSVNWTDWPADGEDGL